MIDFRQKPHPPLPPPEVATSPAITEIGDIDEHWWSSDEELQDRRQVIHTKSSRSTPQFDKSKTIGTKTAPRRYSVQKPSRDKSRRRLHQQNARAGIKVVTDFASPRTRTGKAVSDRRDGNRGKNNTGYPAQLTSQRYGAPISHGSRDQKTNVGPTAPKPYETDSGRPLTSMSLFFSLDKTPDGDTSGIRAANLPQMPSVAPKWRQEGNPTQRLPPGNDHTGGQFVNLGDLMNIGQHHDKKGDPTPLPQNRQAQDRSASEPQTINSSQDRVNQTRYMGLGDIASPSPKRARTGGVVKERGLGLTPLKIKDKLSPSDRKILIGLDIPDNNSLKSKESGLRKEAESAKNPSGQSAAPVTPAILITPARENSLWQEAKENNSLRSRPRARSSVYSQVTVGNIDGSTLYSHNSNSPFGSRRGMGSPPSRSIRDSEITVFEEDIPPSSSSGRDAQNAASSRFRPPPINTRHTRGLSVDTITNRPRSSGWWNVITSPWLTRSSTIASRKGFSPDEDQPKLPSLAHAAEMIRKHHERKQSEKIMSSPLLTDEKPEDDEYDTMTTTYTRDLHDTAPPKDHGTNDTKEAGAAAAAVGMVPLELSPDSPDHYLDEKNDPSNPYYQPKQGGIHAWFPAPAPTSPPRFVHSPEEKSPDSLFSPGDREVPMVFDDAYGQARNHDDPAVRPQTGSRSISTVVEEPETPTVHRADAIRIIQGPGLARSRAENGQAKYTSPIPPPYSKKPAPVAVNAYSSSHEYPQSPGPLSPGLRRVIMTTRAEPMSEVPLTPASKSYPKDFEHPSKQWPPMPVRPESKKRRPFAGVLVPNPKKKRKVFIGLTCGAVALIILIVILAMTVHKKSKAAVVQSQWLNITGFPPIPTGVSTIVQPDNAVENDGCVSPSTMWSCAVPKEIQQSILPSPPNQPSFAFQILYRNDTTLSSNTKRSVVSNPVSVRRLLGDVNLAIRDSSAFWTSSPPPPSLEEQKFIGQTTDNNTSSQPEGEPTPFYLSFETTSSTPSKLRKRQGSGSDGFPDATAGVPPPALNADGTAKAANLLPLPVMQPLRLYNRGLETEHYGFYNYFDRSIFSTSQLLLNQTEATPAPITSDENGGATEKEAKLQCTWAQTRFLVQIWTQSNRTGASLIAPTGSTKAPSASPSAASTATTQPGSFLYPITITTDRHGGDISKKMVYCYGLDDEQKVITSQKTVELENRAVGGVLQGGGQGPLGPNVTAAQGGMGGIDGGSGGCSCQWRNWRPGN